MKTIAPRRNIRAAGSMFFLCALMIFVVCGCAETAKGFKRDLESLKKADGWFKEHYW